MRSSIGAMVVQSYIDSERYEETDVHLLMAVSEQAALAIWRKRAEEALRLKKAHIERLFEVVQEGVVMVDGQGVVMDVNPEFTRLFGYTDQEAIGAPLVDLISPPDRIDEVRAVARRMAKGEKVAYETWRKRTDGARINVPAMPSSMPVMMIDRKNPEFN